MGQQEHAAVVKGALTEEFLERVYLVVEALKAGDLSPRVRPWQDPACEKVGRSLNETLEHLSRVIGEVNRIQNEIGHMGQLGPQAQVEGVQGDWKKMIDLVNQTAGNLTNQIRNFERAMGAMEKGEYDFRATAPAYGELRQLRDSINRVMEKMGEERVGA